MDRQALGKVEIDRTFTRDEILEMHRLGRQPVHRALLRTEFATFRQPGDHPH